MKRIVCFALMILVLLCCFNISLACPEHGPIYDQIDMYYTSYWAANSTHHYMQNEYDLVCAICGYVTHVIIISYRDTVKIIDISNPRLPYIAKGI